MEMRWIRGLFLLLITCTWVLMTSAVVLSSSTKANSVLDVSVNSNVAGQNTVAVPSLSSVSMSSLKFSLSSTLAISSSSLVALSSGMAKEVSTPALPLVSFKLVSSLAVVSKSVARSSRPSRSESAPVAMSSSWALEQGIRTSVLPSVSSFLFSSLAISPSSLQRGYLSSVVVSTSLALDKRTTKTPSPSSVLLASSTMVSPRLVCPNMATLKETSGVLTSPYYPRRYPFNEKCSWKIIASKGERIVLVIKDIYIRTCGSSCTCDYLEIQNGSSSDGIAGRRRCRYWKDRGIVYHSAKDVLRVTFVSNGTTYRRYRGFKATYIKVKYNATTTACTSGEYLNGFSGFFSTPNFPRNFPQYSRCTWNITVPSAYIIKLSFLYFRLEPYQYRHRCYYYVPGARVTVTNVASDDGYQPFMLCGQKLPDPVYSVGNSVRVIFTSLNSQYPGFNATYTAITYSSVCPKMATLNETSGILTSPYYPRLYPSNEKCSWKITASKGERIVLVIEDIHIWDCGSSCTCDYLEIQNGLSSDGISGRRRCRSDKDSGIVYYSAKDVLRVTFVSYSDTYWQYSGFKATYIKVKYNATTTACISGEYLNGFSGFFSTPKFPSNYPQYSRCTWNITVPSGYIIKLSFFYFRLEPNQYIPCYYDAPGARVTVTNVASDDGYQPFMLCGQSLPPAVYSVGNSVQVIFTSLNSQYPGFIAAYTAISYSSVCPNTTILKETSGVITSPFYPRYYSNKQSCSWEIRARKGKRILLTIENMDIGEVDIGDSSGDWGCGEEWPSLCGYLEIQGGSISGYDGPKCRVCSVPLRANATYLWFKERIKVLFVSDGTIVCGTRFKLSYTQVTFGVSEFPHKTTTKVPPATKEFYTPLTIAENKELVLNCTMYGFDGKHEWSRKDGEPAVTATRILTEDTRLNITDASVEDAGEYICRNGPTVTHRFVVTVEVFVKVQMIVKVLNYEYTPELKNKSSPAYKATEKNFTAEMDKLYKNTPGYVRTEVLNFTKGSVNVDFRVIIVINAIDPKNASAIPDAKAETTHQVVREAKTGFVKQLQVSPVVEVFSPPLEPRGIEIFEEKSDKLGVRWEPSEDADAFKVESYHVQYRELLTKIPQNASVPSTEKKDTYSYLIKDLEPKTTYMIRVGAENRHGINFNEERAHKTLAPPFAKWIIVLIVLGILLVTGIIVGLIVFTRRRAEQRRRRLEEEEDGRFGGLSGDVRLASVPKYETRNVKGIKFSFANKSFMPSEANWKEIPYEKITLMNELGSGAFGVVYKGELKQDNGNVTPCAVKTLKESATTEEMRDLYNELEIMTNVGYHPNLVNLLGACTQDGPLLVVIEIAENGNLLELLRKSRETNQNYGNIQGTVLTSDTRLRIAADVAKGMAHLANGRWIHRDLAARNVLLAKNYVAKVADYGMARDIYEQLMYKKETQGKLPVKWMAIESLETYIFTTESDVWSYGVLLWEMESGGLKPYAGLSTTELIDQLKKGYRLEKPDGCSDAVYQIMRDCWNPNPKSRPTFDDLVTRLENMAVSS